MIPPSTFSDKPGNYQLFRLRADSELDFEGGLSDSFYCLFSVRSFLTLLLAVGNIAVYGGMAPPPWIRPWFCQNVKSLGCGSPTPPTSVRPFLEFNLFSRDS